MNKLINIGYDVLNSFYVWYGKFRVKNIVIDNVSFSYYDNCNENENILILLHGFSSNKKSLLPIASKISKKYRIIIPDLIGHGDTKYLNDNIDEIDLNIYFHIDILKKFIINLNDKSIKYHIFGHSMGGLLAGVFSAKNPELIKSISLACPTGISMLQNSPVYVHYMNTGENLLSIATSSKAKKLLCLMNDKYKILPNIVFNYFSSEYVKNSYLYDKIFEELIIENYPYLETQLKYITSNMLILWGDNDNIIDKSCITIIEEEVNTLLDIYIIKKANHIITQTHSSICAKRLDLHIQKNLL